MITLCFQFSQSTLEWDRIKVTYGAIEPEGTIVVGVGQSATFHCGSSTPVIWRFPNNFIPMEHHDQQTHTITLKDLQTSDEGLCYCFGHFADGEIFYDYSYVKVVPELLPGHVLPSRVEVPEGSSIKIICESTVPVKWIGLNLFIQKVHGGDSTLILEQVTRNDSGPYLCIGQDEDRELFHTTSEVIVGGQLEMIPANLSSLLRLSENYNTFINSYRYRVSRVIESYNLTTYFSEMIY